MEAAIASDGKVTVQATGRIVAVSENIPPAARNSQTNRIPVRSSGLLFLRAPAIRSCSILLFDRRRR